MLDRNHGHELAEPRPRSDHAPTLDHFLLKMKCQSFLLTETMRQRNVVDLQIGMCKTWLQWFKPPLTTDSPNPKYKPLRRPHWTLERPWRGPNTTRSIPIPGSNHDKVSPRPRCDDAIDYHKFVPGLPDHCVAFEFPLTGPRDVLHDDDKNDNLRTKSAPGWKYALNLSLAVRIVSN